jgi:hypothetical protein
MSKTGAIVATFVFGCVCVHGQGQWPVKVDRLDSHLKQEMELPAKGAGNPPTVREIALGKVRVALYPREENVDCCLNLNPFTATTTSRSGKFEFKKVAAGNYWFVAFLGERQYKLPIEYEPSKLPNDTVEYVYTLNRFGKLVMKELVTVT